MNSKSFLQIGGVVLLILGAVGFLLERPLGDLIWFTPLENIAHTALGIVALVLSALPLGSLKKWIVVLVGLIALAFGVWGFLLADASSPNFYGAHLDNPVDNVIHIVVGVWALLSAFGKRKVAG